MINLCKKFLLICGRHPLAAGIFGILSALGLAFSIISSHENSKQSSRIENYIHNVQSSLELDCMYRPCWTAVNLFEKDLSALPEDEVRSKLPPSFRRLYNMSFYMVEKCRIGFLFHNESVNYYTWSADKQKCPFDWNRNLDLPNTRIIQGEPFLAELINPDNFPDGIPRMELTTGCPQCRKNGSPTIEFMIPSGQFFGNPNRSKIDRYFQIGYSHPDLESDDGRYLRGMDIFKKLLKEKYPGRDADDISEFCGLDLSREIFLAFADTPVHRVGISRIGREGFGWELCKDAKDDFSSAL